jgi:hypothetical protein
MLMQQGWERVAAYGLQRGDVISSGETVVETYAGALTPRGKLYVVLDGPRGRRCALWGKYTLIGRRERTNV